jgi:hypothetical protein
MTDIEKAKQLFHHQEYEKSTSLFMKILQDGSLKTDTIEYPDILCYLGDSRLKIYEKTENKSLIYEALIDFATAANALFASHETISTDLNNRIKKCTELL